MINLSNAFYFDVEPKQTHSRERSQWAKPNDCERIYSAIATSTAMMNERERESFQQQSQNIEVIQQSYFSIAAGFFFPHHHRHYLYRMPPYHLCEIMNANLLLHWDSISNACRVHYKSAHMWAAHCHPTVATTTTTINSVICLNIVILFIFSLWLASSLWSNNREKRPKSPSQDRNALRHTGTHIHG